MRRRHFLASALALATVPLTASPTLAQSTSLFGAPTLSFTSAHEAGFDPGRLAKAFQFVQKRVSSGLVPGAVLLVARHGCIAGWHAFGQIDRRGGAMRRDAIFDLEFDQQSCRNRPGCYVACRTRCLTPRRPCSKISSRFRSTW